jgi:UDP-3-O-acyl-N-acetylglucosamine deacetylase
MTYRATVTKSVEQEGLNVLGGYTTSFTVQPAAPGTGRVFRCGEIGLPATLEFAVHDHPIPCYSTIALKRGFVKFIEIEHVLQGLSMAGIDDAIIDIPPPSHEGYDTQPFVPRPATIGPFVEALRAVRDETNRLRNYWTINPGFPVVTMPAIPPCCGDKAYVRLTEHEGFSLSYETGFAGQPHTVQQDRIDFTDPASVDRLKGVRGLTIVPSLSGVEHQLAAHGLTDANTLFVDSDRFHNLNGMPHEFVLHKIIDAKAAIDLVGPMKDVHFHFYRSGHKMDLHVMKEFVGGGVLQNMQ